MPAIRSVVVAFGVVLMLAANAGHPRAEVADRAVSRAFLTVLVGEESDKARAWELIETQWEPSFLPMALETIRLTRDPEVSGVLLGIMDRETGAGLGHDLDAWQRRMWNAPEARHPRYAAFKSALYSLIDPRFSAYFDTAGEPLIRLDEIVWGGVRQDGIPPLRNPAMLAAEDAAYLEDDNIVFGLSVNGDARAYPKRILAWHEMFVDTVGGVPVAGVYCTLCGTVILYRTEHEGVHHRLGTSGFLYRSNKLMYDQDTQSLWSTMQGAPVVGPLAGKSIALESGPVVTTTWGEWRRRHPGTRVLSLDTGHRRDYAEGAAYRDYFATDELMFSVPVLDTRLKNKDEVFTVRLADRPDAPLAISAEFLAANPVHHDAIEGTALVVLTDPSGANRAYASQKVRFARYDGDTRVEDSAGTIWTMDEHALTAEDGRALRRLPAQRAFWFGWYAAFPNTRLVR
ncbi:MAG: DUF3179 domain-containing protein [Defluviicoccus sp.]|nr:DUF3179 domain-containing protein [Defluviicoccus sp.]